MIDATEREQRRIGDILHNTLAQQLTGSALALKAISDALLKRGVPEAAKLERIARILNDGVTQARELVHSLRPTELDSASLIAALSDLAARASVKVPCTFDCPKPVRIPNAAALQLHRIAQEAVENALQHAQAGEIVISLRENKDRVVLKIRDDGVGSAYLPESGGMENMHGCLIMQTRASIIGATLRIERRRTARGTSVCCEMDVQK